MFDHNGPREITKHPQSGCLKAIGNPVGNVMHDLAPLGVFVALFRTENSLQQPIVVFGDSCDNPAAETRGSTTPS
jgi:hypothetical protein